MDIVTVLGKEILEIPEYKNKTVGQLLKIIKGLFDNSCGYSSGEMDMYDHQNVQVFKEAQTLLIDLGDINHKQCKRL